jgi:perosamine synthetase
LKKLDAISRGGASQPSAATRLEIPGVTPPYAPDNAPTYQSLRGLIRLSRHAGDDYGALLDGVATRRGVMAIHEEPHYVQAFGRVSLPVTEAATRETLLLPLYMTMTEGEQDRVIAALRASLHLA